jgi:hypothetical protein
MASNPVYVGAPKTWQAALSAANTNVDGTGTLVDVVSAGSSGSRLDKVRICATGTTTLGKVRLFLFDGTNTYLYKEILVPAVTPSTSIAVFDQDYDLDGLVLPASTWKLRAAPNNAEAFKVFVKGGDL